MYVAYNSHGDMVADGCSFDEAFDAALALGYYEDEIWLFKVTP